ncbi:hypothetical protein K490DRAFT_68053 [Saccharata proteae CBS 121410]|uniref:Mediator of RNA polymerase II transcription subunit 8 n=1 Tax=Saccharata proteae CBS 121410 TaxID=1314787 RepID=A0A9P4HRL9_9PEZI|nr:hypothetical protein K490DRAFT_68053 [Saccharata proteae CBS 121410]
MSMTAIPARPRLNEDVKNLETILQRVSTLSTAITALYQTHASQFEPGRDLQLAPWPTMQHQTTIVEKRLSSLLEAVDEHQPLLNAAHVHPTGAFNSRNPMHENILLQLIRKKLQPEVEDWVHEGVAAGEKLEVSGASQNGGGATGGGGDMDVDGDESSAGLSAAQYEELWDWAGPAGNAIARQIIEGAGEDEEDEDEDDEEGEDEDEDEEMEDAGAKDKGKAAVVSGPPKKPMMPLEQILRFASTGIQT